LSVIVFFLFRATGFTPEASFLVFWDFFHFPCFSVHFFQATESWSFSPLHSFFAIGEMGYIRAPFLSFFFWLLPQVLLTAFVSFRWWTAAVPFNPPRVLFSHPTLKVATFPRRQLPRPVRRHGKPLFWPSFPFFFMNHALLFGFIPPNLPGRF